MERMNKQSDQYPKYCFHLPWVNRGDNVRKVTHICWTSGCLFLFGAWCKRHAFLLWKLFVNGGHSIVHKDIYAFNVRLQPLHPYVVYSSPCTFNKTSPSQLHLTAGSDSCSLKALLKLGLEFSKLITSVCTNVKLGRGIVRDHVCLMIRVRTLLLQLPSLLQSYRIASMLNKSMHSLHATMMNSVNTMDKNVID